MDTSFDVEMAHYPVATLDAGAPSEGVSGAERNWFAVASIILLPVPPLAVVFGTLGINAAKNGQATNRSLALVGASLGWLGVVSVLTALLVSVGFGAATAT